MHQASKFMTTRTARSLAHTAQRIHINDMEKMKIVLAAQHASLLARKYHSGLNEESFMNGTTVSYMEEMFNLWLKDRSSVHASWDSYFRRVLKGALAGQAYQSPPTITPTSARVEVPSMPMPYHPTSSPPTEQPYVPPHLPPPPPPPQQQQQHIVPTPTVSTKPIIDKDFIHKQQLLMSVITAYQNRGHLIAKLDPLGFTYSYYGAKKPVHEVKHPERTAIHKKINELTKDDMNTVFELPPTTFIGGGQTSLPLKEIIERLENAYCKHIGVETSHIESEEILEWLKKRFEPPKVTEMNESRRKFTLEQLVSSETLEEFSDIKWNTQARFGLEGGETLIPGIHEIIDSSAINGAECIIIGTSHRGRMNILANICEQPMELIFAEFFSIPVEENMPSDVKYHLGSNTMVHNKASNKQINIIMMSNPSHLELVNPITSGKARAEQKMRKDTEGNKVVSIVLHGDAGISGEGVVYESFNMAALPCYTTHGTIHIVCNNQIGYTTYPYLGRSSKYCTAVAKIMDAAILHVNNDDADAVMYCCKVAAEFRNKFHKDVIIDIIGYRRRGHSETDDPVPTAPVLYKKIQTTPPIMKIYSKRLIAEKIVTETEYESLVAKYRSLFDEAFKKAEKIKTRSLKTWLDTKWDDYFRGKDPMKIEPTGVKEDILMHIGSVMSKPPEKLSVHRSITRMLKGRAEMLKEKKVNWALAEVMAFGSLLKEGVHVRMTGEDCERGTFNQRHHFYHDVNNETVQYNPMTSLFPDQEEYCICNSPLTEFAVIGFEAGYASTIPNALVVWEAQYGDFANVGQAMFDNILACGEAKWLKQCSLVVMLPHGMEGAGPEHSNARIERYLQMAPDDPDVFPDLKDKNHVINQLRETNWIVANCSVPANLFHILRRQMKLPFRKPLILMTPKSLLRHPEVISPLSDLIEGTEFKRVIPEDGPASKVPDKVERLIFCSGKAYFDIKEGRKARELEEKIALTRIEQICPFPYDLVKAEILKYPKAELCWGQEEHKNSGPWNYVFPRIDLTAGDARNPVIYAGRLPSASPASAVRSSFLAEKEQYINECLKLDHIPQSPKGTPQSSPKQPEIKVLKKNTIPKISAKLNESLFHMTLSNTQDGKRDKLRRVKKKPEMKHKLYYTPYQKSNHKPKKMYHKIIPFIPSSKDKYLSDFVFGSITTINSKSRGKCSISSINSVMEKNIKTNKPIQKIYPDPIFGTVTHPKSVCKEETYETTKISDGQEKGRYDKIKRQPMKENEQCKQSNIITGNIMHKINQTGTVTITNTGNVLSCNTVKDKPTANNSKVNKKTDTILIENNDTRTDINPNKEICKTEAQENEVDRFSFTVSQTDTSGIKSSENTHKNCVTLNKQLYKEEEILSKDSGKQSNENLGEIQIKTVLKYIPHDPENSLVTCELKPSEGLNYDSNRFNKTSDKSNGGTLEKQAIKNEGLFQWSVIVGLVLDQFKIENYELQTTRQSSHENLNAQEVPHNATMKKKTSKTSFKKPYSDAIAETEVTSSVSEEKIRTYPRKQNALNLEHLTHGKASEFEHPQSFPTNAEKVLLNLQGIKKESELPTTLSKIDFILQKKSSSKPAPSSKITDTNHFKNIKTSLHDTSDIFVRENIPSLSDFKANAKPKPHPSKNLGKEKTKMETGHINSTILTEMLVSNVNSKQEPKTEPPPSRSVPYFKRTKDNDHPINSKKCESLVHKQNVQSNKTNSSLKQENSSSESNKTSKQTSTYSNIYKKRRPASAPTEKKIKVQDKLAPIEECTVLKSIPSEKNNYLTTSEQITSQSKVSLSLSNLKQNKKENTKTLDIFSHKESKNSQNEFFPKKTALKSSTSFECKHSRTRSTVNVNNLDRTEILTKKCISNKESLQNYVKNKNHNAKQGIKKLQTPNMSSLNLNIASNLNEKDLNTKLNLTNTENNINQNPIESSPPNCPPTHHSITEVEKDELTLRVEESIKKALESVKHHSKTIPPTQKQKNMTDKMQENICKLAKNLKTKDIDLLEKDENCINNKPNKNITKKIVSNLTTRKDGKTNVKPTTHMNNINKNKITTTPEFEPTPKKHRDATGMKYATFINDITEKITDVKDMTSPDLTNTIDFVSIDKKRIDMDPSKRLNIESNSRSHEKNMSNDIITSVKEKLSDMLHKRHITTNLNLEDSRKNKNTDAPKFENDCKYITENNLNIKFTKTIFPCAVKQISLPELSTRHEYDDENNNSNDIKLEHISKSFHSMSDTIHVDNKTKEINDNLFFRNTNSVKIIHDNVNNTSLRNHKDLIKNNKHYENLTLDNNSKPSLIFVNESCKTKLASKLTNIKNMSGEENPTTYKECKEGKSDNKKSFHAQQHMKTSEQHNSNLLEEKLKFSNVKTHEPSKLNSCSTDKNNQHKNTSMNSNARSALQTSRDNHDSETMILELEKFENNINDTLNNVKINNDNFKILDKVDTTWTALKCKNDLKVCEPVLGNEILTNKSKPILEYMKAKYNENIMKDQSCLTLDKVTSNVYESSAEKLNKDITPIKPSLEKTNFCSNLMASNTVTEFNKEMPQKISKYKCQTDQINEMHKSLHSGKNFIETISNNILEKVNDHIQENKINLNATDNKGPKLTVHQISEENTSIHKTKTLSDIEETKLNNLYNPEKNRSYLLHKKNCQEQDIYKSVSDVKELLAENIKSEATDGKVPMLESQKTNIPVNNHTSQSKANDNVSDPNSDVMSMSKKCANSTNRNAVCDGQTKALMCSNSDDKKIRETGNAKPKIMQSKEALRFFCTIYANYTTSNSQNNIYNFNNKIGLLNVVSGSSDFGKREAGFVALIQTEESENNPGTFEGSFKKQNESSPTTYCNTGSSLTLMTDHISSKEETMVFDCSTSNSFPIHDTDCKTNYHVKSENSIIHEIKAESTNSSKSIKHYPAKDIRKTINLTANTMENASSYKQPIPLCLDEGKMADDAQKVIHEGDCKWKESKCITAETVLNLDGSHLPTLTDTMHLTLSSHTDFTENSKYFSMSLSNIHISKFNFVPDLMHTVEKSHMLNNSAYMYCKFFGLSTDYLYFPSFKTCTQINYSGSCEKESKDLKQDGMFSYKPITAESNLPIVHSKNLCNVPMIPPDIKKEMYFVEAYEENDFKCTRTCTDNSNELTTSETKLLTALVDNTSKSSTISKNLPLVISDIKNENKSSQTNEKNRNVDNKDFHSISNTIMKSTAMPKDAHDHTEISSSNSRRERKNINESQIKSENSNLNSLSSLHNLPVLVSSNSNCCLPMKPTIDIKETNKEPCKEILEYQTVNKSDSMVKPTSFEFKPIKADQDFMYNFPNTSHIGTIQNIYDTDKINIIELAYNEQDTKILDRNEINESLEIDNGEKEFKNQKDNIKSKQNHKKTELREINPIKTISKKDIKTKKISSLGSPSQMLSGHGAFKSATKTDNYNNCVNHYKKTIKSEITVPSAKVSIKTQNKSNNATHTSMNKSSIKKQEKLNSKCSSKLKDDNHQIVSKQCMSTWMSQKSKYYTENKKGVLPNKNRNTEKKSVHEEENVISENSIGEYRSNIETSLEDPDDDSRYIVPLKKVDDSAPGIRSIRFNFLTDLQPEEKEDHGKESN